MVQKTRLGFKIYSLEDELLVNEDVDFERKDMNAALTSLMKERGRKLRNYTRHKDKYNKQRRDRASTIEGKYYAAKRKAKNAGYGWEMTKDQWVRVWMDAGFIIVPGTVSPTTPLGVRVTAFSLRGPNKYTNTLMARKDTTKPWAHDNAYIVFRGDPLIGSRYHAISRGPE